jgi:hypothetical protein
VLFQVRDDGVAHLSRARQKVPPREALPLLDRLEDQRFLLAAHAFDRADAAGLCRG